MVDSGSAANKSNSYFTDGISKNIFIKSGISSNVTVDTIEIDDVLLGNTWAGFSAFPDWTAPNTQSWWSGGLTKLYDDTHFDGIWLDMNEATMLNCDGECYPD